ncbi:hypothetical protein JQS43_08380 [Natronosporangium hydrolyticum]|uniref:Uncharacterized protein n=1 Tax=Natronosporangium hydrolyticum TaxID=2811111 RepID=A0A895YEL3_9ACTN|nr:hypothetical protein [Natronosporangium hydrolyticum]QSB16294.1 hypothetical protein JQS43_08380 [Natronosporangium hydrolyticum]
MSKPSFVAGFDSTTGMLQATAACLRGEPFPAAGHPPGLKGPARATRRLPQRLRESAFLLGGAAETVSSRRAARIDPEEISEWVVEQYPKRKYPVIVIGSASGALVHLCAALGVPWLPQTFLIPVRQRVHPDDVDAAFAKGLEPGRELVANNPTLQLHHMHDANQDRIMVRALTYFRVKRRELGEAYERFLLDHLAPGGTILISECARTWDTTTVGPRHVFQHGAVGGATDAEFHYGGPRVVDYLARHDSPVRQWSGPELDGVSPEAEWGFAPALRDDIERFAGQHQFQVRRLIFDEPESISPMVADLYRWWYRQRNLPSNRLFAESFIILEPYWTLRTGSVPYWMTFNTDPSLARLAEYLANREPFDEIMLALFQNAVEMIGLPSVDDWREQVLSRARRAGWFAGLSPEHHPRDLGHLASYDDALKELPARYPLPGPLTLAELDDFLAAQGDYPEVRWERGGVAASQRATMPA